MLRYFAARPFAGLQLPHERALSFAAVMAAAEARAFLQPRLHTLNPVCRTQGELSGKVPKSVCSAVFSMENACSSVQDVIFFFRLVPCGAWYVSLQSRWTPTAHFS